MGDNDELPPIVNADDLLNTMPEQRVRLGDDDSVIFLKAQDNYEYPIELDRIPDFQGLVEWIHHLMEKTWMDNLFVREFINAVCAAKGWELYRGL